MDIKPIAGSIGARIDGIDLGRTLDNAMWAAVHRAFRDHLVLQFRGQHLTPAQHKAFAARFGPLMPNTYFPGIDGHPEIIEVVKREDEVKAQNFGGTWHTDLSFLERPPLGAVLNFIETPDAGGDTIFVNLYAAYEALSAGMRAMLDPLKAVHSGVAFYGTNGNFWQEDGPLAPGSMEIKRNAEADTEAVHPVVRTHPGTGRKALFVNPAYTDRFDGMTPEESAPLLDFLNAHARRPEFTCRLRWRAGDVGIWDNRVTQHLAVNDYDGQRRVMHRVSIAGERPI